MAVETETLDKPKAAVPAAVTEEKPKPLTQPIRDDRFFGEGIRQNRWTAFPVRGTPLEDVLDPKYWAHIAGPRGVRPPDLITVVAEDYSYYAELLVVGSFGNFLDVRVLTHRDFKSKPRLGENAAAMFEIVNEGPIRMWEVKVKETGRVLKSKCQTEGQAQLFLREHIEQARQVRQS